MAVHAGAQLLSQWLFALFCQEYELLSALFVHTKQTTIENSMCHNWNRSSALSNKVLSCYGHDIKCHFASDFPRGFVALLWHTRLVTTNVWDFCAILWLKVCGIVCLSVMRAGGGFLVFRNEVCANLGNLGFKSLQTCWAVHASQFRNNRLGLTLNFYNLKFNHSPSQIPCGKRN